MGLCLFNYCDSLNGNRYKNVMYEQNCYILYMYCVVNVLYARVVKGLCLAVAFGLLC
jgi:hypothetical protein